MTRVLITGVAGFIGSHVADECLRQGFQVIGVDDLSGGFEENVPKGVDFRRGSVTDAEWIAGIFKETSFDYVYHLAAYAAEGLSHFIRRFTYQTNLMGSINLINQSVLKRVKCFVFTSSIAVYGTAQTPMTEEIIPQPEDPYGISKYAVELDLKVAFHMFGLPYIIFRPHNVYGDRQNIADRYRNVIGIFMNQVMSQKKMTIFGDGTQTRAFSHIQDVAPILAQAPSYPKAYQQVFNVGADHPYSVLELAHEVARAFDVEPDIQYLESRKEVVHAFASHEKARNFFDIPPVLTLQEGIRRMAEWARRRGPMSPVTVDKMEVFVNLPPSWARKSAPPARGTD